VSQITKLQLTVLRPKPGNLSKWFLGQTTRTIATGFEAKPGETVDLSFVAKPRNPRTSSPYVWCRSHTASPNISIVRPSSTRLVLDHPRSSGPCLLLLRRSLSLPTMPHLSPTHHETSKHVSPHEIDSRVEQQKKFEFKFKLRQVNYSS
jgi:hypothetical protein